MKDDDYLERGIDALRSDGDVRPEWRERLLELIETQPDPRQSAPVHDRRAIAAGRIVLRPLMGVAAAIGFVALGVALGRLSRDADAEGIARGDSALFSLASPGAAGEAALVAVHFMLVAPGARQVALVGDFNQWNAAAMPMRRSRNGQAWIIEVGLRPGRHAYAFVVDDDIVADPAAPAAVGEDFGVPSSVVHVAEAVR